MAKTSMTGRDTTSADRIVKATGIVAVITVVVKLLGFGEKVVCAYYLGTGAEIDAYLIAFSIPFMIFIIVRELVEPAFLPTFMESVRGHGEESGWKLFSTVVNAVVVILAAATLCGVIFAPSLVSVFAPGFQGGKRELTVELTRMIMPACLVLGVSTVTYITLNAYKRFTVPALGDVLFKGLAIVVFVLGYRFIGVRGLVIGVVAGGCARFGIHAIGLWKKRTMYRRGFDFSDPSFTKMRRLMLPLVVGIAFSQLSLVIDNMFASTLETGSIASLAYSKKLVEMPVIVLPYALGIVIFPFFSELAISQDHEKLRGMLMEALKLLAFLFIPMALGMIVLRVPLIEVLFERGAFGGHSTALTSSALLYYALGLFSFAVEAVMVQFYFSMFDTKTPIVVGVLCVILNVALTVLLIRPLGHRGIALALTVSKSVKVAALYCLLKRKFAYLDAKHPLRFLIKIASSSLCMGVFVYAANDWLSNRLPAGLAFQVLLVCALAVCGAALYVSVLILLRAGEIKVYYGYVRSNAGLIFRRGR